MSAAHDFDALSVGDFVTFSRRFTAADWTSFSALSGDDNPLHWDAAYAAATPYGRPIVPLHLATAPFSAIAGSMIPGRRALYLGCRMQALAPMFFDDETTYSARVTALSAAGRTLTLQAIALRGREILLEAEMRVQVRDEDAAAARPDAGTAVPLRHRRDRHSVVVTGASGAIGREVVRRLAAQGRPVLAIGRRESTLGAPAGCRAVQADLATDRGRTAAAQAIAAVEHLGAVIHLASAPLEASVSDLFGVNLTAFRAMADAALPAMLGAQHGRLVLAGSKAVQTWPAGMENYAAAKAAASAYADHLSRQYRRYGIDTVTLAPDYVESSFSSAVRGAASPALLPEEVAESIVRLVDPESDAASAYVLLTQSGLQPGRFGFTSDGADSMSAQHAPEQRTAAAAPSRGDDRLGAVVREALRLSPQEDLAGQALDITPGWDSLRHLELMMSVEREIGIHFSSAEIAETRTFPTLARLVSGKLQRR
jgi:3-oxoacyl-[acyl-carrier protein] reductase